MNKRETGMILAYVIGACPQQQVNELTPEAWHDILGHLDYRECREAARAVAARQPFVAPAEIIREIADKRSVDQPHSEACRKADHRNCLMGWCNCTCHPRAVDRLAGPPALPSATRQQVTQREPGDPHQLSPGDLAAIRRSP